jgi:Flp pilus assembly protein TadD
VAHHALALSLIRRHRLPDAVAELRIAASLAPDEPSYAQTLTLAERRLQESGGR